MDCYSNFVEMLSATQVRTETRVAVETAYQKKVEALLNDENCFKIIFVRSALLYSVLVKGWQC